MANSVVKKNDYFKQQDNEDNSYNDVEMTEMKMQGDEPSKNGSTKANEHGIY